jgi:uncharacterized protein
MKLVKEDARIALLDDQGSLVGEVSFPEVDGIRQITHTFVAEAYRGQGIAGKLLDELVIELRERKLQAFPLCSYSVAYFAKHPEAQDVVKR